MDAVLFDMDGVVVDSEAHWAELEEARFAKVAPAATVEEITGMNYREVYEYLDNEYDVSVDREAFLEWYTETAQEIYGERASLMAGFHDLVMELRAAGTQVALVTSSPTAWYSIVLERFGLDEAFDVVASAEAVERGKPAPDVYEHAAAALGVDPGRCVAVEDSVHGATAAVEAGMICIGYRPDGGDLSPVERIVTRPAELQEVLFDYCT